MQNCFNEYDDQGLTSFYIKKQQFITRQFLLSMLMRWKPCSSTFLQNGALEHVDAGKKNHLCLSIFSSVLRNGTKSDYKLRRVSAMSVKLVRNNAVEPETWIEL